MIKKMKNKPYNSPSLKFEEKNKSNIIKKPIPLISVKGIALERSRGSYFHNDFLRGAFVLHKSLSDIK